MPTPTAKIVPWSSVVGQIVTLHDETGRTVAQLGIRISTDAAGDQDIKSCAGHVARWVVDAFDALAEREQREGHARLLSAIAEKQIA